MTDHSPNPALLVAHCPTCDKYTEQQPDEAGNKSCFICHTPYKQHTP